MVANGAAMQAIMQTSQEEIKISRVLATKAHRISESMKKDSLSMRTVSPFVETGNAKQWTDIFEDCSMHDAISSRDIVCSHSFHAILRYRSERPISVLALDHLDSSVDHDCIWVLFLAPVSQ